MNLRELHEAATPGPWGHTINWVTRNGGPFFRTEFDTDAAFIEGYRNNAEAICDLIEQMEREHAHHSIPGSVACHGCLLLGRLDSATEGEPLHKRLGLTELPNSQANIDRETRKRLSATEGEE